MLGLMQDWPLLCHKIIDNAARQHGNREIVSRTVEGPIVRTTYRELRQRALKVAQKLEREGYGHGDRIATMAWNSARHLEAWFGIMGMGGVYHTLNPRLFPEQIAWIMNHAEDRAVFVDLTFLPLIEKLAPAVKSLKKVIVLTDAAHMPQTSLPNAVPTRSGWRTPTATSPGRASTRIPPQACATRPARRETRKGCSTATVPTSFTP
jgi:fatty-acyl-CoA synthase